MSNSCDSCPSCGDPLGACNAHRHAATTGDFICSRHETTESHPDDDLEPESAESEDIDQALADVRRNRQHLVSAHTALVTAFDVEQAPPDDAGRVLDALHASEDATAHTRHLTEAVILEWLRETGTDELVVGQRRFWVGRPKTTQVRDLRTALVMILPLLIAGVVLPVVEHDTDAAGRVYMAVADAIAELFPASALRHGACRELLRSTAERVVRQNHDRFLHDDGGLDERTPLSPAEKAQADTLLRCSWEALFEVSRSPQTRLQTGRARPQ